MVRPTSSTGYDLAVERSPQNNTMSTTADTLEARGMNSDGASAKILQKPNGYVGSDRE
jgi:hypothetical protein